MIPAQDRQLVWSDEFDGPSIDQTIWAFESGPANDNIHYYTDRLKNARIVDGKLQLVAQEETFNGYPYTSAQIRSERSQYWKYGRIEARIKLPQGSGFVPAFWLLPEDNTYGWWPFSGEIDIMEYPTNEKTKIYGTVHTQLFNFFSGLYPPQSGIIEIQDAASAFHIYAIEWNSDQIDFYVDDQKYHTFNKVPNDPPKWPFDHPFFVILNLAVGGGWVGAPPEETEFPAVMEVDYVRVYQYPQEIEILGMDHVTYHSQSMSYLLNPLEGAKYVWLGKGGDPIISEPGTSEIQVDWGIF